MHRTRCLPWVFYIPVLRWTWDSIGRKGRSIWSQVGDLEGTGEDRIHTTNLSRSLTWDTQGRPERETPSDFGSDPNTQKSMTGYLMSLIVGAISWRSSRQGGCPHVHPLLPIESQFCEHHLSRTKPTIYHNVSRRVIGLLFVIYRFEMLGACRGVSKKTNFFETAAFTRRGDKTAPH
jgi:hypothetical protein